MDFADQKFIIASGPVIVENDKVLLNRHGDDNFWKFVGGRVEASEINSGSADLLESACRREVLEEMGLEIEIISPLKPMVVRHQSKENTFVVLIHFLARRKSEIKKAIEIREFGWFPIDELPDECAPNIKPVIENYKELIAKNIIKKY